MDELGLRRGAWHRRIQRPASVSKGASKRAHASRAGSKSAAESSKAKSTKDSGRCVAALTSLSEVRECLDRGARSRKGQELDEDGLMIIAGRTAFTLIRRRWSTRSELPERYGSRRTPGTRGQRSVRSDSTCRLSRGSMGAELGARSSRIKTLGARRCGPEGRGTHRCRRTDSASPHSWGSMKRGTGCRIAIVWGCGARILRAQGAGARCVWS
ncbi:hypothetical protein DFH09DRAFT_256996 [Mycena vulgaris]|nr:hypothetical protein DFH09DRAFT_256996 [Mycena vulgaris]